MVVCGEIGNAPGQVAPGREVLVRDQPHQRQGLDSERGIAEQRRESIQQREQKGSPGRAPGRKPSGELMVDGHFHRVLLPDHN
jgi:hypothetical protein